MCENHIIPLIGSTKMNIDTKKLFSDQFQVFTFLELWLSSMIEL
ncbi:hypothetical protein EV13_1871 [Prochlorococcus sp. MIT 0702]|nr:hypothetical protein EV13_1871 [Prochlorococcus sp. MIT 0702]KGG29631.1 hypothetical protein EV12_0040 [Prochlorococcus sp. MIT 0701]KGG34368.1 hypothetical protein EV14_1264 [Prochlorococcus sp. MIT 0703]